MINNTPKLRFPEFTDEWQEKRLGDLAVKVGSGSTPKGGSAVYQTSGIPFIRSQNVNGNKLDLSEVVFIDSQIHSLMSGTVVKPGDVLLNITGASLGRTCVVPADFVEGNVSQHVCIIRAKDGAEPYFVHTILSMPRSLSNLLMAQTGGGKEGLNFQAIRAFKLSLPDLEEQQKIADFLCAVDKKIELLEQKKKAFEKYKKGVMQAIFSHKICFREPDGSSFPEWEEKKLGEIISVSMGQSPNSDAYNESGNGSYLIQGNADISNRKTAPRFWTSLVTKTCEIGDIILTVRAPSGYVAISLHNACIGRGVCAIKCKQTSNRDYIYQFLLWFEPRWINIEQGSTFSAISGDDIKSLDIFVPVVAEQVKIADFLTSLDNKVDLINNQLEQSKFFKKALLQQMFV